jgi:uncharacterized protein
MMRLLANFISGIIFGLGLALSGMSNPAKVQNFLDIAGTWDPSLAFVMAGAIAVTATGYVWVMRRQQPMYDNQFDLPPTSPIDAQLLAGAAIFGVGWGLGGFCPGPAIASLALAAKGTVVFIAAMLIGISAAQFLRRNRLLIR